MELDEERRWSVEFQMVRSCGWDDHVLSRTDTMGSTRLIFEHEGERSRMHNQATPHTGTHLMSGEKPGRNRFLVEYRSCTDVLETMR